MTARIGAKKAKKEIARDRSLSLNPLSRIQPHSRVNTPLITTKSDKRSSSLASGIVKPDVVLSNNTVMKEYKAFLEVDISRENHLLTVFISLLYFS
jgi:hypothetical protein